MLSTMAHVSEGGALASKDAEHYWLSRQVSLSEPGTQRTAQRSLISLPRPWVQKLVQMVDEKSLPGLLRTCRCIRNLVLAERTSELQLDCTKSSDAAFCVASLELAAHYSKVEHVRFVNRSKALARPAAVIAELCIHSVQLWTITHASFQNMDLDLLVPSWLLRACPNLTTLTLDSCDIVRLPQRGVPLPDWHQVEELHLSHLPQVPAPKLRGWLEQFKRLTGVHKLHYKGDITGTPLQCMTCVGKQLTELLLETALQPAVYQAPTVFPNVRTLTIPDTFLNDQGMDSLLQMSHLATVLCKGFYLTHNYSNHPCSWRVFTCNNRQLHVGQMALLPQSVLAAFKILPSAARGKEDRRNGQAWGDSGPAWSIVPGPDASRNREVIATLHEAGIKCVAVPGGEDVIVAIENPMREHVDRDCVMTTLPLLDVFQCDTIIIKDVDMVHSDMVHALLQQQERVTTLVFSNCSWHEDAWAALLPCLPSSVATVRFEESLKHPVTEQHLAAMCTEATRPIRVVVQKLGVDLVRRAWHAMLRHCYLNDRALQYVALVVVGSEC